MVHLLTGAELLVVALRVSNCVRVDLPVDLSVVELGEHTAPLQDLELGLALESSDVRVQLLAG